MSSSRKFLFNDEWDSFDDLEQSLDKALNQAPDAFSNYSNAQDSTASRHTSEGSIQGIPLRSLRRESRSSGYYEYMNNDDEDPLMDSRFGQNGRTFSAGTGSQGSFSSLLNNVVKNVVSLFRLAKHELHQEKIKQNVNENGQQLESRFISPKNFRHQRPQFPTNAISNAKYNFITFIPIILFEQFKFFFNLYFLLVALSQIIPQLRIGYLSSYIVPLVFVLTVTMLKEMGDDIARRRRDREQNNELFEVLNRNNSLSQEVTYVASQDLKVGDILRLHKDRRIPADSVLLQTSDKGGTGEAFIKTDQLDGETDWKLRIAPSIAQKQTSIDEIIQKLSVVVEAPNRAIHHFNGKLLYNPTGDANDSSVESYPLTVDQSLWANTVLASGTAIGIVIYTGVETRQSLNSSKTGVKTGLLELEINKLSKILCFTVFILSVILVCASEWPLKSDWYIRIMRFLILFSTIIPVSLRVNLDLAKYVYASQIENDHEIANTIVRTSTIPEDLGRIEYLLSDKTGTLTQNDMELKKIHLGAVCYTDDSLDIVSEHVANMISSPELMGSKATSNSALSKKRDLGTKVTDLILTLALCHNVTPTYDDSDISSEVTYQAASPDEIAIVKFTESVGLKLIKRDRKSIALLHLASGKEVVFEILYNFPFNSDTKRMGIIAKESTRNDFWFLQKGADSVMAEIVSGNDWLTEETGNMAREGLRTLVIGRKKLNPALYQEFVEQYEKASLTMSGREASMQKVISYFLEKDLELLGLTGVEDRLQHDVKASIELLRNAGIKIWMLTGDKVETARCVSLNARIISRGQHIHQITNLALGESALAHLEALRANMNCCLLIDGESLATFIKHYKVQFFSVAICLPAVIACRCTPQQKADVAIIIKEITGKRVCCIGDGGNDVSMIQSADVGVGIVGKEGKQASLAADFSIDQFCNLLKLLLWHGRNSYKRSAKLGQFVIYRGLLISVAQVIYSISSKFEPLALYQGWLMVGYSTLYTMAPVFSLVLDYDIDEKYTRLYPELYKELTLGKSLSYRTFFMWFTISLYQGCVIQLFSQFFQTLKESEFLKMVSLSFSCLVYNELVMVAFSINRWNLIILSSIIATLAIYIASIPFLKEYFDLKFVVSLDNIWQTAVILSVSLFPVWVYKYIDRKLRPPTYAKVQQD